MAALVSQPSFVLIIYFDLSMVLSYVCLMCQIQPCSMCDLCEVQQ